MNLASKVHASSIFSRTKNWDLIIQWCHHFMTHALGPVLGLEVVEWQLDSVHLLRQKRAHPRDITIGMFYPRLKIQWCAAPCPAQQATENEILAILAQMAKPEGCNGTSYLPMTDWRKVYQVSFKYHTDLYRTSDILQDWLPRPMAIQWMIHAISQLWSVVVRSNVYNNNTIIIYYPMGYLEFRLSPHIEVLK